MVRLLLKAGADPRAADVSGLTALHYAAALGKSKAADALILDGADVDARDIHGITPLHLAAAGGHTAIVTLLVGAGADPDPGFTVDGSALQAARERVQAVVEILLIQQDRESRKERRLP